MWVMTRRKRRAPEFSNCMDWAKGEGEVRGNKATIP